MNSIILAALLTLNPGYNNPGVAGEVVAIEAATTNATATIAIKSVQTITAYTNATAQVITYEPAWRVTVTNYNPSPLTYTLPADCYPVTEGSATYETTGVSVPSWDPSLLVLANPDGMDIATFSRSAPYAFIRGESATLKFAGASGVPGEWPCIEVSGDPASYVTNVIGYLNYDDFKTTNGVSTIVGDPVRFDMPITNTVITATLPAATYAKTNDLASVTTSGHFGSVTTNAYLLGGGILVTGAAEGDSIKVLIK